MYHYRPMNKFGADSPRLPSYPSPSASDFMNIIWIIHFSITLHVDLPSPPLASFVCQRVMQIILIYSITYIFSGSFSIVFLGSPHLSIFLIALTPFLLSCPLTFIFSSSSSKLAFQLFFLR